jgi:methylphosphotriester-DNA--protein-cysteine methyltransferase
MAASVHMSASSFLQRFKDVITMSPLQYQKVLRLHEARRLMLFHKIASNEQCSRGPHDDPRLLDLDHCTFDGDGHRR